MSRAGQPDVVDAVTTPRLRDRVRANRGLLLVAVLVVVGALLLAIAQSSRQRGYLDPRAVDPTGSAALATLLEEQGVRVVRVTSTQAAVDAVRAGGGRATLLVAPTAPLSPQMLELVATTDPTRLVLVTPRPDTLAALAPWAQFGGQRSSTDEVPPACAWDVAQRAGPLPEAGTAYTTSAPDVHVCWGGGVVDDSRRPNGSTTVLGLDRGLTNEHLDESGYAAMAMNLLGQTDTLVWWLPSAGDPLQFPAESDVQLTDLIPSWVAWALLQVAVAVLLTVWWRGRRLGRVVLEPLPVVVRATETVEGRARLYRRSNARGRAADALRGSTTGRLRGRLSLPRGAPLAEVVAAVAARTGRPETEVAALLVPGTDPTDDASLTRLAQALDNLENEVRRT